MDMITKHTGVATLAIVGLLFAGTACEDNHNDTGREYAPQMYDAVGYEPYKQIRPNTVNPYGHMRPLPCVIT